jgi:hypothetical protein
MGRRERRKVTTVVEGMTVPGIDPLISSAMVAVIGTGTAFAKGRDFGLARPRADRTILGSLSKHANGYLRMLFMQAARVILLRPANWPKHGFGVVLAAALANKLARIAWTVPQVVRQEMALLRGQAVRSGFAHWNRRRPARRHAR